MIWLPGFLSQGGKKYTWNRYAIAYGEKAGTAATVSRTYNKSKYASTAYTIQNGVFVLTSPVVTTFLNLKAGKYTVDMADSTNSVSKGSTLYKVTTNGGTTFTQIESAQTGSSLSTPDEAYYSCTALNFSTSTGKFSSGTIVQKKPSEYKVNDVFYGFGSFGSFTATSKYNSSIYSTGSDSAYKFTITQAYNSSTQTTFYTRKTLSASPNSTSISIKYTPYSVSKTRGDLIDTVTDADPAAYPENGIQDGYWYVLQ